MAHMIDNSAGKNAFYSLRESAWHKLGQVVNAPVHDERVLELAGLDWSVDLRPVSTMDTDGNPILIPNKRCALRSDTCNPLGVVGDDYATVQNSAMLNFFREVCDKDCTIETAGALDEGQRVWALARMPNLNLAIGKDVSNGYLLITNRHDGMGSVRIMPTMIRVVCNNTLTAALGSSDGGHRIRHTKNVQTTIDSIARQYAGAIKGFELQKAQMEALARKTTRGESLQAIMNQAFEVTTDSLRDEAQRARTIRVNRENRIKVIRQTETCDMEGTRGTLFADLMAVTEWIDHDWSDDAERGLFGVGVAAKQRALDAALALV